MGMFRRKADAEAPPEVADSTLFGAHQNGGCGSSGMTHGYLAQNLNDAGGRVDLLGRIEQEGTAQPLTDLPPASSYADRPLFGGVRTAPATREFLAEPGMSGGYLVMAERVPAQLGSLGAEQATPVSSVRTVPSTDSSSEPEAAGDLAALQRAALTDAMGWDRR